MWFQVFNTGRNQNHELGGAEGESIGTKPSELGDQLRALEFGVGKIVDDMALGEHHACALFTDGSVKCWGRNRYGELGQGDKRERGQPSSMGDSLMPIKCEMRNAKCGFLRREAHHRGAGDLW